MSASKTGALQLVARLEVPEGGVLIDFEDQSTA